MGIIGRHVPALRRSTRAVVLGGPGSRADAGAVDTSRAPPGTGGRVGAHACGARAPDGVTVMTARDRAMTAIRRAAV